MNKDDWCRWCWRRMAWKNDPSLWCDMHPRLAWLIDRLYEPSWPIREVFIDLGRAARDKATIQAARDVYGLREIEVWPGDYGDSAAEIYERGAAQGWTGKRNSVKPYTRRELATMRLVHHFKLDQVIMDQLSDDHLFELLDTYNRAGV